MTTLEFLVLRAIQSGSFRPKPGGREMAERMVEQGLLARRGQRWELTEDGVGAIEAYQEDQRQK